MIFTPLGTATFTGIDNAELGAAWDSGYTGYNAFTINTNRARGAANTAAIESFNTTTPSNDQYAQAIISVWSSSQQFGPLVRMANPATPTFYLGLANFFSPDPSTEIYKVVNDAYTQLAEDAPSVNLVATDELKFAVLGTDLFLFNNDAEILSASDSAIASGKAGMFGVYYPSLSGNVIVDNFEMGDVDPDSGVVIPVFMHSYRLRRS